MGAIIYRPRKSATQSGLGNTKCWVLEYQPQADDFIDPLTGWHGSGDTKRQIRLHFATRQQAIAYAERHKLPFQLVPEEKEKIKPKSYADNFKRH